MKQKLSKKKSESATSQINRPVQVLGGLLIFLAGTRVGRLDTSLSRSMQNLTEYASQQATTTSSNGIRGSGSNFQLAFDQSYGFFDDLTEEDWKIHRDWARQQGNHRYVFAPDRQWGNPALWYYNNYNPIFNCPHQKRVTGIGDGPKWMCDPHRLVRQAERRKAAGLPGPHCLIYSVGSNGNYEFEDGLFNLIGDVCEIHIFDFSANYERPENSERNMHFHQLGLQGTQQNRLRGEFASFPEILKRLGHENKTIDIFKIDCEGCEWETYKDWIGYDMRQVLIETHELPADKELGFDYFNSFKKNNLLMYSKEVNGFGGGKFYEFSYLKLHPDFLGAGSPTVAEQQ